MKYNTTNVARKLKHGEEDRSILRSIFDLLCERPYGVGVAEIVDYLYGKRADGGPLCAGNVIYVQVHRFNQLSRKERCGLRIRRGRHGACGIVYQIFLVRE